MREKDAGRILHALPIAFRYTRCQDILDFPDPDGVRLLCSSFFDDWFLYAIADDNKFVYGLVKMREQEHDAENGDYADGDAPGVTVSFISFDMGVLIRCLEDPTDENREALSEEISRVVSCRGQNHDKAFKKYFSDPRSKAPYLIADLYTRHVASFAKNGMIDVPKHYGEIVQQSRSYKNSARLARLPRFIESLNEKAGRTICDNEKIYIHNSEEPDELERAAILATHTANTSIFSFAAEVEYHASFLFTLAKIKIPFFSKSIYDSAIRADMTVDDNEFEGPAPFYRFDSRIVQRQYACHKDSTPYAFDLNSTPLKQQI